MRRRGLRSSAGTWRREQVVRTAVQAHRDRLTVAVDGLTLLLLVVVTAGVVAVTMFLAAGGTA